MALDDFPFMVTWAVPSASLAASIPRLFSVVASTQANVMLDQIPVLILCRGSFDEVYRT